jgi:glycopeptide antibiotics resistance protein
MKTLTIRRPVTFILLLLVTLGIFAVTTRLAGKSYTKMDPVPFEDLRHISERLERRHVSTQIVAVLVVPIIANVLLFAPWGFFMFHLLYTDQRPTVQTYVLTILLGVSFSTSIEAYQYFLPSRVADINDIIWNSVGTTVGALIAHIRARIRFDFR